MGSEKASLLFYICSFNLMPKPAALYFWCAMSAIYYLDMELKSLYAEKRPYWVTDEISASDCSLGFGNPSGHMLNNTFFWMSLYLHAYHEVGIKPVRMSVMCTGYIIKMAATCIGISFIIFLAFSRVFLGAHSINQVIFGTILGATFAIIGHYRVKPIFLALPESMRNVGLGPKYRVTVCSFFKAFMYGLILPMTLAVLVLLMKDDSAFYRSNQYRYRQTRAGCTPEQLEDSHSLSYLHF